MLGCCALCKALWCRPKPWRCAVRNGIEVNPAIHFGKPCVAGTRIPVQDVLELAREGVGFEAIIRDYYPGLTE